MTDTSTALTVIPAPLTVTADPNQSMTYGDTPDLTFTYTGLVNGDSSASFTGSLGGATSWSGAGTDAITQGDLAATGNYTIGTFNADTLTVTPAPLTITVISVSRVYGAADPALGVWYSGLVNFDFPSVLDGTLAVVDADSAPSTAVG